MGFWWIVIAVCIVVTGASLLLGGAGGLAIAGIAVTTIVGASVLWYLARNTRRLPK
jgi:hypothetical protein